MTPTPAQRAAAARLLVYRFNPGQQRAAQGRWVAGGGGGAPAVHSPPPAPAPAKPAPGKRKRVPKPGPSRKAAADAALRAEQDMKAHAGAPGAPRPGHAAHGAFMAALKGHARLIAAHAAHAFGQRDAAKRHLARAAAHLKTAGEHHGLTERGQGDMARLTAALKPKKAKKPPKPREG